MYDLIIIGAGPAGASLARLLGGKRKVLLADARPLDAAPRAFSVKHKKSKTKKVFFREKCCGGLLAPDAINWLAKQEFSLPAAVLNPIQPDALRSLDLSSSLERVYPCSYLNLNRHAFEEWLVSLLPTSIDTLYSHRCTAIKQDHNGYTVTFKGVNGPVVHTSKMVVGADGANSCVRRYLERKPRSGIQYLAVQDSFGFDEIERIGEPGLLKEYVAFFHPGLTDFYGWIIPKDDRILLGMAMPPAARGLRDAAMRMQQMKGLLTALGYNFNGKFSRVGCNLLRPSVRDVFHGKGGAYLIGEAAGWISPSSAEGYSYAFISAAALAKAILKGDGQEKILRAYQLGTLPLMGNIIFKQAKSLIMFNPLLRQLVMHSGVLAKV